MCIVLSAVNKVLYQDLWKRTVWDNLFWHNNNFFINKTIKCTWCVTGKTGNKFKTGIKMDWLYYTFIKVWYISQIFYAICLPDIVCCAPLKWLFHFHLQISRSCTSQPGQLYTWLMHHDHQATLSWGRFQECQWCWS